MKRVISAGCMCVLSALILTGCGGSDNPITAVTPPGTNATKATTKVNLFGNMSSNGKIASVNTAMTVPNGIMVNYSSPPGATSGIFPLRQGVAVPSGPAQVAASDIT